MYNLQLQGSYIYTSVKELFFIDNILGSYTNEIEVVKEEVIVQRKSTPDIFKKEMFKISSKAVIKSLDRL